MKTKTIVNHLSIPAVLSVIAFIVALYRELFEIGTLVAYLVGGLLSLSAPYYLWLVIMITFDFSKAVSHSGFIACSIALLTICCFWLLPNGPTGLPVEWKLYWPLAAVLMVVIPAFTAVYTHKQSPRQ